jgi:hypothetical protein
MPLKNILLIAPSIIILSFASSSAKAGTIPMIDETALVALEATGNELTLIESSLPQPLNGQLGTWSGTITASGWALNFSGQLDGTSISIAESGILNIPAGIFSWTDAGSVGASPLSGFGSMQLDTLAWDQTVIDGEKEVIAAQIVACLLLPVDCGIVGLESALVIKAGGGDIIAQSSVGSLEPGLGPFSLNSTEQFNNSFTVVANGILNVDGTATFQSSVTPIPEPSSVFLLAGGLSVLCFCCRRRK